MDEKRIAERVAKSVSASVSWTGSTYDDAEKAGKLVEEMGRDMKEVVAMVIEGADDLEDDFKEYNDDEYVRHASNLKRNIKKAGAVVEKALSVVQQDLRELKGQIEHFSDIM